MLRTLAAQPWPCLRSLYAAWAVPLQFEPSQGALGQATGVPRDCARCMAACHWQELLRAHVHSSCPPACMQLPAGGAAARVARHVPHHLPAAASSSGCLVTFQVHAYLTYRPPAHLSSTDGQVLGSRCCGGAGGGGCPRCPALPSGRPDRAALCRRGRLHTSCLLHRLERRPDGSLPTAS